MAGIWNQPRNNKAAEYAGRGSAEIINIKTDGGSVGERFLRCDRVQFVALVLLVRLNLNVLLETGR